MMINLDCKYQKEKQKEQVQQCAKQQIDVNKNVLSALDQMKTNINKNYHLEQNLRKYILQSTSHVNNQKFEIEQIYSKDNSKSTLKHTIPLVSLNKQRRKIRNTLKSFSIQESHDFSEEQPLSIYQMIPEQKMQAQHTELQLKHLNKIQDYAGPKKSSHSSLLPNSSIPTQRSNNFFITNPLISRKATSNSLNLRSKEKKKSQISYTLDTQYSSPYNSSRAMTNNLQSSQQLVNNKKDFLKLQTESLYTSPYINPLSTGESMNTFNLKNDTQRSMSNYSPHRNQNNPTQPINLDQDNSLFSNKNYQLSQGNYFNSIPQTQPRLFSSNFSSPQNAFQHEVPESYQMKQNDFNDKPSNPNEKSKTYNNSTLQRDAQNGTSQNDGNLNRLSKEMNEEDIEEDRTQSFTFPLNQILIQENQAKQNDEKFVAEPKQFYYIDNNEMQSVQEFMYRVQKYEQFKRYEQSRSKKSQRYQQIQDVQQLLIFRSEKAAREVAQANVRKYIMKNKIRISDKEIDDWVDKIKIVPLEQNQRLTFRESNRQIISFQLMGTVQEKQFFKIQREIDKALNKINRPVKFIQQFHIYQNNRAKNFSNAQPTQNQISMAIINQLPSQYLIDKPPASFFNQNSQSMNRISSAYSLRQISMNQIQHHISKVIEQEEKED